jgi:hypothetical protein
MKKNNPGSLGHGSLGDGSLGQIRNGSLGQGILGDESGILGQIIVVHFSTFRHIQFKAN